jgi:hypothetical protein
MKKIILFFLLLCTTLLLAKRYPITKSAPEEWLVGPFVGNDPFICNFRNAILVVGYDWTTGTTARSFEIQADGGLIEVSINSNWKYSTDPYCYANICRIPTGGDTCVALLNDSFLDAVGYIRTSSISWSGRFTKIVWDSVSLGTNCDQSQMLYMNNNNYVVVALENSATGGVVYAKSFTISAEGDISSAFVDSLASAAYRNQWHGKMTAVKVSNSVFAVVGLAEGIGGDTDLGVQVETFTIDADGDIQQGEYYYHGDEISQVPTMCYKEEGMLVVGYHNTAVNYPRFFTIKVDSSLGDLTDILSIEYFDDSVAQSENTWYGSALFPISGRNSSWLSAWAIANYSIGNFYRPALYMNTFRTHKNLNRFSSYEQIISSDTISLGAGSEMYEPSNILCKSATDSIYYIAFADSSGGAKNYTYVWALKVSPGTWSHDYLDVASPAMINEVSRSSIGDVNGVD